MVAAAARVGSTAAFNNPGFVRRSAEPLTVTDTSVRYLRGHALHPLYRDGTTNSILPKNGAPLNRLISAAHAEPAEDLSIVLAELRRDIAHLHTFTDPDRRADVRDLAFAQRAQIASPAALTIK